MSGCVTLPSGQKCPAPTDKSCKQWSLTNTGDVCYIDNAQQEMLNISGADINVFKLLGIHEQGQLVDLTGSGKAISGGDADQFPASNAFDIYQTEWHSLQRGSSVVEKAFIGYDFGEIKLPTGRDRYAVDANIRHHITTIKIKQSSHVPKRATRVRVERSDDGKQWFGVAIVDLPDTDQLETIYFRHSVPNRYWRLRPINFSGGSSDYWSIVALQMIDYMVTSLDNIEDKILLENRNRDYAEQAITLKGHYDLVDQASELTRFGIELPTLTYSIKVNFNATLSKLNRPVVIGDIIELPSEMQYTPSMKPVKKYLEVTDVTWDTDSYTPGWFPTTLKLTAQPALASQETQDIFGDLANKVDSSGLLSPDESKGKQYQDLQEITQFIQAEAKTAVPERGSESSNTLRQFTPQEIQQAIDQGFTGLLNIQPNQYGIYMEDGLPPNQLPYTEGEAFPTNPIDGDYHRIVYTGSAEGIPAKLYRWSTAKNRWIYMETDRRQQFNNDKPVLQEFLGSKNKKPAGEIK